MNLFSTIPNTLTVSRMLLLPFFALGFFIKSKFGILLSSTVFAFCCITDYLDGYYARTYKQTSKLGQVLDPLADKVLISVSLLFVAGFGLIDKSSIIPAAIILCREILISGVRDGTLVGGTKAFSTAKLAKWKTATQMISITAILSAAAINDADLRYAGELMLWFSSLVALVSGFLYCRKYFS